jgi:hypothetical protein
VEKKGGGGFDGGHVLGGVRRGGVPLARVEEEAPAGDQDPPAAGMGGTAMLGTRQERGGGIHQHVGPAATVTGFKPTE